MVLSKDADATAKFMCLTCHKSYLDPADAYKCCTEIERIESWACAACGFHYCCKDAAAKCCSIAVLEKAIAQQKEMIARCAREGYRLQQLLERTKGLTEEVAYVEGI